jgi:peptide/nickel transport system permease protein
LSYGPYILQRLIVSLLLLVGASIVLFLMLRLLPGDPSRVILGLRYTPEAAQQITERLGLNRSLPEQYFLWISQALRGDLGQDYRNNRPIGVILRQRLPVTFQLAIMAMLFAVVLAFLIGILVTIYPFQVNQWVSDMLSTLGMSLPEFWLGIMLILLFSEQLRWLPPSGYVNPGDNLLGNLQRMVLPSLTLGIGLAAVLLRFIQTGLAAVMKQDYIRTAKARGLTYTRVVLKHALRNASLPIITVIGLQLGYLLGGAVIVEEVFSLPGVGRLIVSAVMERNYLVAQSAILVVVTYFIAINFLVDLLYGVLDPRIRR